MRSLLKSEEALILVACVYLFAQLPIAFWWFPVLILSPDIGMAGYLANPRTGAWTYNFTHHRGLAFGLWAAGLATDQVVLQSAGLLMLAHIALDRLLGYGLKYEKGFTFTHLGEIGTKTRKT